MSKQIESNILRHFWKNATLNPKMIKMENFIDNDSENGSSDESDNEDDNDSNDEAESDNEKMMMNPMNNLLRVKKLF